MPKLKPLFNVISGLICWEIWKRRNKLRHGDKMSFYSMISEINRNIHQLATVKYPWLRNIPKEWPSLVRFLEGYKPCVVPKVIYWKAPN